MKSRLTKLALAYFYTKALNWFLWTKNSRSVLSKNFQTKQAPGNGNC